MYKLSRKVQARKKGKDGKSKHLNLYFLNDILILKQKLPFDENFEEGFNIRTTIQDEYLLNNILYQTRIKDGKIRDVKFPISKVILYDFNIPENLKINI